ncbi:ATP-binding cassette domain-containing protein [Nocardia farcinica]|uniref:ATP-binding cassette domain-containing protein n=1 Tax=Nocardia farcinica TaxID=37329 RepID=UPI00245649DA|nr:ATP-binding cassette domain-containing protein [Nocardia farcinica]
MSTDLDRPRLGSLFARGHELPTAPVRGQVTLRARGLVVERRGGSGPARRVLDQVDFAVAAGEIVALVGPNGAGKSTLLAALAGELTPAAGGVELDGHPLTHWSPLDMARRRAVLPQTHTVGFPFTARVADNEVSRKVVEIEKAGGTFEDVRELVAGARGRRVFEEGDLDAGIWSAGLAQGLIHDIPTCAELIGRMVEEAEQLIRSRLADVVVA